MNPIASLQMIPRAGSHLGRSLDLARNLALVCAAALAAATPALAQFKVVQPDGRVLYTDIPPVSTDARVTSLGRQAVPLVREAALPDSLRRVAERYPVTLYASTDCEPCNSGRQLLQQRGVPYQERLVISNEDILALERLVGSRTVPALVIGTQPVRGYTAQEWGAYLDVAGYPHESALPAGWKPPPPRALVERSAAPSNGAPTPAPLPSARSEPTPPVVPASGGLRF